MIDYLWRLEVEEKEMVGEKREGDEMVGGGGLRGTGEGIGKESRRPMKMWLRGRKKNNRKRGIGKLRLEVDEAKGRGGEEEEE